MNHREALHRVFRPCLTPLTSALALLSIVACGVFSSDATPAPPSTAPANVTAGVRIRPDPLAWIDGQDRG